VNEPHRDKEDAAKETSPFDAMVRGLIEGDNLAYAEFWEQYGKRLEGVVRSKFPMGLKRRLEPEDLVQSVCRSFFRRATGGQLEFSGDESLWRLLCAITLNKMKMKQRFHYAKRRRLTQESDVAIQSSDGDSDRFEPVGTGQSPDDAAMFAEQLEQVMNTLDATEQNVLQLKLDGFSNEEISGKLRRSDRTVRRILKRMQIKLEALLPPSLRPISPR
jgi:RNA polymerase sigma-70 factor (ECF subfamily)